MACSGYQLCFETPVLGRICICVPLLIDPWWRFKIPGPQDRGWLDIKGLNREEVRQISTLATIADLASELPGDLGRDIKKGVTAQMKTLSGKLGGGLQITEHKAGHTGT